MSKGGSSRGCNGAGIHPGSVPYTSVLPPPPSLPDLTVGGEEKEGSPKACVIVDTLDRVIVIPKSLMFNLLSTVIYLGSILDLLLSTWALF